MVDRPITRTRVVGKAWVLPFVLLLFVLFIEWLQNLSFTPVLPQMQKAWGMNFTQIGFFTGLLGLMGLIVSLPYGEFVKRVGTRNGTMVAVGCVALGMVVIAMANNFTQGVIGRAMASGGYRASQVALFSAVAMTAPKNVMASVMGLTFTLSNTATLIGTLLLGGFIGATYGWQAVFWGMATITALAWVLFAVFFHPRSPEAVASALAVNTLSGEEIVVRSIPSAEAVAQAEHAKEKEPSALSRAI